MVESQRYNLGFFFGFIMIHFEAHIHFIYQSFLYYL